MSTHVLLLLIPDELPQGHTMFPGDEFCSAFADHDAYGVCIAADNVRHHAGIGDA